MQTFVVRVFVPAEETALALRGVVEHVGSGEARTFEDRDGLFAFFEERLQVTSQPKEDT